MKIAYIGRRHIETKPSILIGCYDPRASWRRWYSSGPVLRAQIPCTSLAFTPCSYSRRSPNFLSRTRLFAEQLCE